MTWVGVRSLHRTVLISIEESAKNNRALRWLAAGYWMEFPPVKEGTFLVNHPLCIRVWNSPPTEGRDHEPEAIETTAWPKTRVHWEVTEYNVDM
ncbi:hypothetical protein M405DRAFT_807054 [Rhizopogon salebrosus TDB-379]|nr:hypothetical protein M405DRAFT_807054 [Rhizopogon salebrosus TDB-379]